MFHLTIYDDNLRIFSAADVGCLSDAEKETLTNVRKAYEARIKVGCTGCEYCMPCPQGVPIPRIFKSYDSASMFDNMEGFRKQYNALEVNASACVECGACLGVCPQHFATPIPEMLKKINEESKNY